jgi:hypothetical protein
MLDYFLNKKNKDAIVAFIEKERLPVHGVVAIKMEFGMPISKEEITSTYDYVMSRYKANSKIDRLSSTILGLSNNPVLESLKQDLEKVVDQVNSMASRILSKEDVKEAREIFKEIDGVMDDISKLGLTDWKGLRVVREKLYGIQETFLGSFYHSSTPIEGQKQCLKLQKLLKEEIVPSIQNAPRSI